MKSLLFQASLIGLSILFVSLLNVSCFKSVASSKSTEVRSSKEMKFKFEDYDVKLPKLLQAKLEQLFPKGSSLSELQSFMERAGAECQVYGELREKEGLNVMGCQYSFGSNPFVKSKWIVVVKSGDDSKISELKVTSGFVGT
jgi:hypothetical protein